MLRRNLSLALLIVLLVLNACSPKVAPYENGPVMSQKDINKVFQPILAFMEYKPGMTVADVGAGSGALTVMMSTLMTDSEVYVQDIDTAVLNNGNMKKILDYYSLQNKNNPANGNTYHLVIGSTTATNLPEKTFDLIYSNATVHNFTAFDEMVTDLGRKLKTKGVLYIRDSFSGDHGEGETCSDPKCGRPLLTIDEFLAAMKRNGFTVVKQTQDLSGYPVFGFSVSE